jgi:hypothetical protein
VVRHGLVAIALAVWVAGCSIFHHDRPSPSQQFTEAIARGDSVQATNIWLHMTPQQREDLAHGVGPKHKVSPDDVKAQLLKHQMAASQAEDGELNDSSDSSPSDTVDFDSQTVEMPTVPDPGSTMQNLQSLQAVK